MTKAKTFEQVHERTHRLRAVFQHRVLSQPAGYMRVCVGVDLAIKTPVYQFVTRKASKIGLYPHA